MKKKILGALVVVAVAAMLAIPAHANCLPDKLFGTWDFSDGSYYYVTWAPGSATDPTQVDGRFWEPGNRAQHNEGEEVAANWLKDYNSSGAWYVSGALGRAGIVGCVSNSMVLAATDPTPATGSAFFVGWADELFVKANNYDYPDLAFVPMPSPQVTASSRAGSSVALDLQFGDPSNGFASRYSRTANEAIDSIVLYQAKGTNPGPAAADWTEIGRFPYGGGVTQVSGFALDCTDETTTFLAAGLSFTGEFDTVHVSAAIAVECDPNLANPGDKFDLIRERGKGEKRGKPFREN